MSQTHPTPTPPMPRPPAGRGLVYALWANAALLAVIAVILLARGERVPGLLSVASAQNTPPIAGGGGVFIMPAQFARETWGTYLLDVDNQTIAAYVFTPTRRQLELVAARSYRYDRALENFNTAAPSPSEVRELLRRQADLRSGMPPTTQPSN